MSTAAAIDTIYECTPRQIREFSLDCFYAGLVPFIKSSPGMGKSSIMRSIARQLNLELRDHRMSTSAPEDMSGLPGFKDGMAIFHPFEELFPLEHTPLPEGKDGWLLFLDEFNAAPKSIQAAAYKLVLDREVGQHKLHDNVVIAMAGNHDTDRAITTQISTAMQSRVIHLRMRTDFNCWLEDVALKQHYDHRVIAYLSWKPAALNDFNPEHSNSTFNCQRTWEFMNNLVKGKEIQDSKIALYAGTITSGTAVDFVQFTKVYSNLPTLESIIKDPTAVQIPTDTATRWAVVCSLADKITEDIFGPVSTYINRFGIESRILFYRTVMAKNPGLHGHSAFIKAMAELSRYLHGTDRKAA